MSLACSSGVSDRIVAMHPFSHKHTNTHTHRDASPTCILLHRSLICCMQTDCFRHTHFPPQDISTQHTLMIRPIVSGYMMNNKRGHVMSADCAQHHLISRSTSRLQAPLTMRAWSSPCRFSHTHTRTNTHTSNHITHPKVAALSTCQAREPVDLGEVGKQSSIVEDTSFPCLMSANSKKV